MNLDPRAIGSYSISQASWYLQISQHTLRNWISGWRWDTQRGEGRSCPLIQIPEPPEDDDYGTGKLLSYWNLVEAYVLRVLRRRRRLKMQRIRDALDYYSSHYGIERPLAHAAFEDDGINIVVQHEGVMTVASDRHRQLVISEMQHHLKRVRWGDGDMATDLFPLLRHTEDPDAPQYIHIRAGVAGGRPLITGSFAPVATFVERFRAGERLADLMEDYGIEDMNRVEEALRWARVLKAA